ncbi:MAG: ribonuclease HII [Candidatus Promineifilaceae bacterium]
METSPSLELEFHIRNTTGRTLIAGLDEAGRGALAGPVAAAAVILPLDKREALSYLSEVNDSKKLTAKKRAYFYDLITEHALAYGIGTSSPIRIDREGIVPATKYAMQQALKHLGMQPEFLLIDGRIRLRGTKIPQNSVVRGDGKSISIAAASILAKVTRDRYMQALDPLYPQYGFASHKGYATKRHVAAIDLHGPLELHRHTFAPVRQTLL